MFMVLHVTRWPQSRRKKFPEFSGLFPKPQTILFHRLSQQKVNVIITFICQVLFHINSSKITGHQRTVTISKIHEFVHIKRRPCCVMQICDQTETILFVKNFPRGCREFPAEKSLSTPGCPGLWSPCVYSNQDKVKLVYPVHLLHV